MRIIYRDSERVLVFSSQAERDEYFREQEWLEQERHSGAIRDIHADYLKELTAENTYNKGTLRMLAALHSKSIIEKGSG